MTNGEDIKLYCGAKHGDLTKFNAFTEAFSQQINHYKSLHPEAQHIIEKPNIYGNKKLFYLFLALTILVIPLTVITYMDGENLRTFRLLFITIPMIPILIRQYLTIKENGGW